MPRRREVAQREILPEPKYGSVQLAKFINVVMVDGKKAVAERIVYDAIETLSEKKKVDSNEAMAMLEKAIDNVKPLVEVKSRRVGGATYQVPVEVRSTRQLALAMRWLREAARKRSEKSMADRLAAEVLDALENRGSAVKKREDVHRMAEANKAFSHYRF